MAVVRTLAAGWPASVLVVVSLPTQTLAASPTRIDFFDPRGNRTGSALVAGDRVDFFDTRGHRTGSARLQDRRRVEFFDARGSRTGYAIKHGDRIDFFDARSGRTGSGRIRDREVETFDGLDAGPPVHRLAP
jgi:2-methylaconitate cis-trans-isomerase PrpF